MYRNTIICKIFGMKVSTSISGAMVLCCKMVDYSHWNSGSSPKNRLSCCQRVGGMMEDATDMQIGGMGTNSFRAGSVNGGEKILCLLSQ